MAVVIALAISAACSRSPGSLSDPAPAPEPRSGRILELPGAYHRGSIAVSTDGKRFAFVETTPEGERVVADGYTGPSYGRCARPRFAPKSNALFYWAANAVDEVVKVVLVTPKAIVPTDVREPGALAFSPDGARWAMLGSMNEEVPNRGGGDQSSEPADAEPRERAIVLVDGSEFGRSASASFPSFSPDRKHVAFVYEDDDHGGAVIVDGKRQRPIGSVEGVCGPSVNSATSGYFSILSARYVSDGRLLVVARDRDGFTVDLGDERLASYPRSAREGGGAFVIAPSEECRVLPAIGPRSFRVAEQAPVAAWWERIAGEEEQWRVVRNGKPVDDVLCDAPWEDEPPQLSSDGTAVAYACVMHQTSAPDQVTVVTPGGQRHGPYSGIWGISFSDDAKGVTWGASSGIGDRAWSIVVDGAPLVERFQSVFRPRFTPDGTRVVWEAQRSARGRSVARRRPTSGGELRRGILGTGFPHTRSRCVDRSKRAARRARRRGNALSMVARTVRRRAARRRNVCRRALR